MPVFLARCIFQNHNAFVGGDFQFDEVWHPVFYFCRFLSILLSQGSSAGFDRVRLVFPFFDCLDGHSRTGFGNVDFLDGHQIPGFELFDRFWRAIADVPLGRHGSHGLDQGQNARLRLVGTVQSPGLDHRNRPFHALGRRERFGLGFGLYRQHHRPGFFLGVAGFQQDGEEFYRYGLVCSVQCSVFRDIGCSKWFKWFNRLAEKRIPMAMIIAI